MTHSTNRRYRSLRTTAILLSLSLLLPVTGWAAVNASLDHDSAYQGDTVNLQIISDQTDAQPDLSPLQKDFEIVGSRQGTQVQIINGHRTDRVSWEVALQPRRSGLLTIPSLQVGPDRTSAIELRVEPQPTAATGTEGDPLFITVSAEPADAQPYVQQQLQFTVRLFSRQRLLDGVLSAPNPDHAVVEQLGEDRSYKGAIKGRDYQVIERKYAIFPEKSGALKIPPITFRGRVSGPDRARSRSRLPGGFDPTMNNLFSEPFFDRFFQNSPLSGGRFGNPGKPVRVQGQATTIEVKPRPAESSGPHWLPADALTVTDSWVNGVPPLRAGEPSTRTITLVAKGMTSSQLPQLKLADSQGLRIYPEQPRQENATDGTWVYGKSEQGFAILASGAGPVTLPELRLKWWDTQADKQREIVLPAMTANVMPGAEPAAPAPTASATQLIAEPVEPAQDGFSYKTILPWLVAGLLAIALLVLAGWWWRSRRTRKPAPDSAETPPVATRAARAMLRDACRNDDPGTAARALLNWATARWPTSPPTNLRALASRLSRGSEQILDLELALYARQAQPWQGKALWEALKGGLREPRPANQSKAELLPPLYPHQPPRAN